MRTDHGTAMKKTASQYSLVVILEILSIQLARLLRQTTSFFPIPGVTGSGTRSRASGRGAGGEKTSFSTLYIQFLRIVIREYGG